MKGPSAHPSRTLGGSGPVVLRSRAKLSGRFAPAARTLAALGHAESLECRVTLAKTGDGDIHGNTGLLEAPEMIRSSTGTALITYPKHPIAYPQSHGRASQTRVESVQLQSRPGLA